MTYAVLAMHRRAEKEQVICHVDSQESAKAIAGKLAKEIYADTLPDGTKGRNLRRYSSVRVQEVA